MNNFFKKTAYLFFGTFAIAFTIMVSILSFTNNRNFYTKQYIKNDATLYTGVSITQLDEITDMLLDYLNDKRDDLDMECTKFGTIAQAFDSREKAHMIDVKVLYLTALKFTYLCFALFALSLCFLILKDRQNVKVNLWKSYKYSFIFSIILIIVLSFVFFFAFDWFWTNFHYVFFDNDLWLLDPNISTMINMFPLEFFLNICENILLMFSILSCILGGTLFLIKKNAKKTY